MNIHSDTDQFTMQVQTEKSYSSVNLAGELWGTRSGRGPRGSMSEI
jgi:hypothetical protein